MMPLHQSEETAEELHSPATSLESSAASVDRESSVGSETGSTMHTPSTDPAALPTRHLQEDVAHVNEEEDRRSSLHYRDSSRKEREGHLMVLLPLSRRDSASERKLIEFRVYVELSAFLAFKHVERRSGSVLPWLTRRLESCGFHWTYEHHDTGFSPIQGASALLSSGFGGPTQAQLQDSSLTTTTATISQHTSTTQSVVFDKAPSNTSEPAAIESANTTIITTFLPGNQSNPQQDDGVAIVANDDMFDEGQGDRPVAEEGEITSSQQSSILPSTNDTSTIEISVGNSTQTVAGALDIFEFATTADEPENDVTTLVDANVRRLQETNEENSENRPTLPQPKLPFAIVGAARSLVSQTIGYLGEALDLPQISSSSTASSLDILSLFARTVPTNNGDAHVIMAYLNRLGVEFVGILYIKDSWGKTFERDLQFYANMYNVTVYSAAYVDESDLESVMQQLKQSRLRYFFGIINPSEWKKVVRVAYRNGILGNSDYQWYFGDLVELVGDNFVLDRETESDIADALHGTGVVLLKVKPHAAFDRAIAAFADNKMMQQEFIQSHAEPHLFDNYTFTPSPGRSLFQYLTYDAVIALGLTACETPGLFTAQEFYNQLLKIDFRGVSGQVRLHETTGTRLGDGLEYEIVNLVFDNNADQSPFLSFDARSSLLVNFSGGLDNIQNTSTPGLPLIQEDYPFIYYDRTETPPPHLPPVEEDMNLIPNGLRYFGLSLAVMIMVLSIACTVFTYRYRMEFVVRASQPIFLAQICLGTFILATTIIPLSFQEDMPGLDIACALNPWFLCIGFTVTIAALFTKARRINKLTQSGTTFRRVQVQAKDVMKPFLVLLSINIILLTAWTASPYRLSWRRKPIANLDEFGRSVESFGMCKADDGSMSLIFVIPLLLANITVMAIATYESYKGRNLPSDFSEARYLAVAMVFLCETFVLGGTTIVAVLTNPTAFFLVSSLVLCIGCLSILLPVFWPKYMQRNKKEQTGRQASTMFITRSGPQGASAYSCGVSGLSAPVSEEEVHSTPRPSLVSQSSAFFASQPQAIKRNAVDSSSGGNSTAPRRQSRMSSVTASRLGPSSGSSIGTNSSISSSKLFGSVRMAFDSSVRNLLDNLGTDTSKNDENMDGSSSFARTSRPIMLSTLPEVQTHLERSTVMENSLADIASENEHTSAPMDMSAVMEGEDSMAESKDCEEKKASGATLVAPVSNGTDTIVS